MRSYGIIALTGGGSALWLLLLSRLPWRRRLGILAAGAVAGTLFVGLFRVRGVTGNLVPLLTRAANEGSRQVLELLAHEQDPTGMAAWRAMTPAAESGPALIRL